MFVGNVAQYMAFFDQRIIGPDNAKDDEDENPTPPTE